MTTTLSAANAASPPATATPARGASSASASPSDGAAAASHSPHAAAINPPTCTPALSVPTESLFHEDFASGDTKQWRPGMGKITVADGVARVVEDPKDHHGATFKAVLKYKDAAASFWFKYDGSRVFNFNIDDKDFTGSHAGHLVRIVVSPRQVTVTDTKSGVFKNDIYEKTRDPNTSAEEKQRIKELIKPFSAAYKQTLDPAVWHSGLVEVVGDELLFSIDGHPAGYLRSPGIAHETKQLVGFTVPGDGMLLDNVQVSAAKGAPDWPQKRSTVLASLTKVE